MKLHRFLFPVSYQVGDLLEITNFALVHQLQHVLHLQQGELLVLFDGKGKEAHVVLQSIDEGKVKVVVTSVLHNNSESLQHVVLYCAVLKHENFEWVVQKATEVGVSEIVPLITARTVKLNLRIERLRKIMQEAAEQSGRGVLPVLNEPMDFQAACASAKSNEKNLFFDVGNISAPGVDSQTVRGSTSNSLGIFIGPEGGWEPSEVEWARSLGFTMASLGALTLRAETAAVVATWWAVHPHT